jgi:hypothetical protein
MSLNILRLAYRLTGSSAQVRCARCFAVNVQVIRRSRHGLLDDPISLIAYFPTFFPALRCFLRCLCCVSSLPAPCSTLCLPNVHTPHPSRLPPAPPLLYSVFSRANSLPCIGLPHRLRASPPPTLALPSHCNDPATAWNKHCLTTVTTTIKAAPRPHRRQAADMAHGTSGREASGT